MRRTYQHAGKNTLTERQLEVLCAIAIGWTDVRIAEALFVSETTVKRHVRDILSKLVARNRAHAVFIACKRGILK